MGGFVGVEVVMWEVMRWEGLWMEVIYWLMYRILHLCLKVWASCNLLIWLVLKIFRIHCQHLLHQNCLVGVSLFAAGGSCYCGVVKVILLVECLHRVFF